MREAALSKRFSAQRKRAFLTYLSQSGNQTLSAERAKVSRSWVQLHRSTDADFDAACREAIEEARERLIEVARLRRDPPPPSADIPSADARRSLEVRSAPPLKGRGDAWRYHDGAELVVESVVAGTGGSGGGKRVQVRRARLKQWTPRVERRFLAALAVTCNVKAACAEVGLWPPSAYNHRHRWPEFARAWDEAVETGYVRIEAALVEHGRLSFGPREEAPELAMPPMTFDQALHLLHMHKHQVRKVGKRPGLRERVMTPEEASGSWRRG